MFVDILWVVTFACEYAWDTNNASSFKEDSYVLM